MIVFQCDNVITISAARMRNPPRDVRSFWMNMAIFAAWGVPENTAHAPATGNMKPDF